MRAANDAGGGGYPTAYIRDRSGRVIWEGIPIFNAAATEKALVAALQAR